MEKNFYITVGVELKKLRKDLGLTQKELSGRWGICYEQIQKYESGLNRLPIDKAIDICELANVSLDEFFKFGVEAYSPMQKRVIELAEEIGLCDSIRVLDTISYINKK